MAPSPLERVQRNLAAMLETQRHRGPDDEGVSCRMVRDWCVGMGHCRLAILDCSPRGHQPMENPDTGDVLSYNGEIYNSPELRSELQAEGYRFRSHSDTEVLLRGYEHWAEGVLGRLRGMFAFALWDERKKRLLLARDHLGIKPLYYAPLPTGGLIWASETKAIAASDLRQASLDPRGLIGYLAYGAVPEPLTAFSEVRMLASGGWRTFDHGGVPVASGSYWEPPNVESRSPLDAATANVAGEGREVLRAAVERHLLSDQPVAVFLSGGLDSTAIASLAGEARTGTRLAAFTVSFPEAPTLDESPAALRTARRLGLTHTVLPVSGREAARWATEALERSDQPAMDGVNTYLVSRSVSEAGFKVALSGQGGDEVFGGYRSFEWLPGLARYLRLLNWLSPARRASLARAVPWGRGATARLKAAEMMEVGADLIRLQLQTRRLFATSDVRRLWGGPLPEGLTADLLPEESAPTPSSRPHDEFVCIRRLETEYYLKNVLLRDADVFGMACSLEIRVPFLDRDVLDWSFRLPGTVFLRPHAPPKDLLRRMFSNVYGADQLNAQKKGFTPPFGDWLAGPLRDTRDAGIHGLVSARVLHDEAIGAILRRFLAQPHTAAWSRVWALVSLGLWIGRQRPAVRVA